MLAFPRVRYGTRRVPAAGAMRWSLNAALAAAAIGSACGCGSSDTANPAAKTAAVAPAVPNDPIARAVYEFLDAVRQGNTAVASQRLTPLALKATAEQDLLFSPPASPTARFEIGEVEMFEDNKAVVDSVWIDFDVDGKPNKEPIIWALRRTEGQWRISGMAAELGPNQPPVIIDFENPAALVQGDRPQTRPMAAGSANPTGAQPSDQVARDPFNQPAAR